MPYKRKIYNVNWNVLAEILTPVWWRTAKLLAFARAISWVFSNVYMKFIVYRKSVKYLLEITPQVYSLEASLNDRYDYSLRRIRIVDAPEKSPIVLFTKAEAKRVTLNTQMEQHTVILYSKMETSNYVADFIIEIPASVAIDEAELRAFIYSRPTKKFIIKRV